MRTTRNTVARVREMNRKRTDPAIKRLPENPSFALGERLVNVVNVELRRERYLRLRVQRLRPRPNQSHR